MRLWLALIALCCCGCRRPELIFNNDPRMTEQQMLDRASVVLIGVIETHSFDSSLYFRPPTQNADLWKVLRRRVQVEIVLRGQEARKQIDVYEISWTGGTAGNWNATQNNERNLFLLREEGGRYHVVRDWWRSIFRVRSGWHARAPLDASRPVWERVALLNLWPGADSSPYLSADWRSDPGDALTPWRKAKLLRGLLRHPKREFRLAACQALLGTQVPQSDCGQQFDAAERKKLEKDGYAARWEASLAERHWQLALNSEPSLLPLFTTIGNERLRQLFCREFRQRFPSSTEHGCTPDGSRPATIVTEAGDVPLLGPWPQ